MRGDSLRFPFAHDNVLQHTGRLAHHQSPCVLCGSIHLHQEVMERQVLHGEGLDSLHHASEALVRQDLDRFTVLDAGIPRAVVWS